jgi:hypothetical protein
MNRLLDRKIAEHAELLAIKVETERAVLFTILSELASGKRQVELGEFEIAACQVRRHVAAYNALVALRTELGE